MENVVSIINTKENPLEFDISIQGVDSGDTTVKFVIETNPVHFGFLCNKNEQGKWVVNIPPLPHLERVSYPFHIEIVVDGYYFEPLRGTLNVTAAPVVKSVNSQDVRTEEEYTEDDDALNAAVEKILNSHKNKKEVKEEQVESEPEKPVKKLTVEQDEKLREAIDAFKKKPFKIKQSKSLSPRREIKETVEEQEPKESRKSNLADIVKHLEEGPELSEQARKVRNILNS